MTEMGRDRTTENSELKKKKEIKRNCMRVKFREFKKNSVRSQN